MNKIKKSRKPITLRRYKQLLEKHLLDTGLVGSSIYPPIQPEEDARARYLASSALTELMKTEKDETKAARIRAQTIINLYQMLLGGTIALQEQMIREKEALAAQVTRRPELNIMENDEAALASEAGVEEASADDFNTPGMMTIENQGEQNNEILPKA